MSQTYQALPRVEKALKRLGLLNKSCEYIKTATKMPVLHTTDVEFESWILKLEKLTQKPNKKAGL